MPGPVPGIHELNRMEGVDGRDKPGRVALLKFSGVVPAKSGDPWPRIVPNC
jgi:hypothetical protein